MLIRIHHRHILNLSICVSKSALFISTDAIGGVIGNGSLSILYAGVESGDLGIGHDVVSADGVALRGAVLVHHVYLQILLLILLHHRRLCYLLILNVLFNFRTLKSRLVAL